MADARVLHFHEDLVGADLVEDDGPHDKVSPRLINNQTLGVDICSGGHGGRRWSKDMPFREKMVVLCSLKSRQAKGVGEAHLRRIKTSRGGAR